MTKNLNIFCSCRVRLTEPQRQALRAAYRHQQTNSPSSPLVMPGSGISVEHAPTNLDINRRLGLPHVVVADLLSTREAVSLPTIFLLQRELGVTIITEKELEKSFSEYLTHIKTNVSTKS